ncbi:hypothetical protein ACFOLA_08935 [Salinicoccus hispanicus]|uniref:AAA family ATPase n=1 Tax=Salinicoccus hispanicus TaxID=157225 RepID=A0A6N8TWB2_9STAP|nr:hypothetical protein [Salinicoccus hispanicus]MXQ49980.1 hypothetical protein [Salinicoccus hispanicus]
MKIDLHLHTKKCKQGDSSKRNVDVTRFIREMKENDVGICSITNHNHFDIEQYEKIIQEAPELLIFPGIELDIKYEDEHYHIIVMCNPKKRKEFYSYFDNDLDRDYNTFFLDYKKFISLIKNFESGDIIVFPHFLDKDKERSLNMNAKEKLREDLEGFLVILEPGKMQTMGVINAHNELSLIGSDVTDWDKYFQYELPEIKFRISSFENFYELASNPSLFVNRYLKDTKKYMVPVKVKEELLSKPVEIYKDINIIFGEKGSGKTILLKSQIYRYLKEEGFNVFLHEGKDYNEQYNNLINNFEKSVVGDETILKRIEENFKFIINYQEQKPFNFLEKIKAYHSNKSANKNAKVIKKTDSQFSNNETKNFKDIIGDLETDLRKVKDVKDINTKIRSVTEKNGIALTEQLNLLNLDLVSASINNYKTIFSAENTELFLTILKESVQKKTGKESKPNNIGFAKLVSQRLARLEANQILIQDLEDVKNSKTHRLGSIPNKGKVSMTTSIEVLESDESYNKKKIFDRSKIVRNRELMKKIKEFNFKDFRKINDYFEVEEKISSSEFSKDMIRKKSVIKIDGNNDYNPSEGERAIITISGLLENDSYDCYLFDEIERGLGQKYITDYIVPKIKEQRDKGKIVIISTHNSNVAINTLPSQTIYCDYSVNTKNIYYMGNLYTNQLIGIDEGNELIWKEKALIHLEGSKEMFGKRRNIYGV